MSRERSQYTYIYIYTRIFGRASRGLDSRNEATNHINNLMMEGLRRHVASSRPKNTKKATCPGKKLPGLTGGARHPNARKPGITDICMIYRIFGCASRSLDSSRPWIRFPTHAPHNHQIRHRTSDATDTGRRSDETDTGARYGAEAAPAARARAR